MNPNDVFPRAALPPAAIPWKREIENRIVDLEKTAIAGSTDLQSENRTTAAVTGELARQLDDLETLLAEIEDLYEAIPKTYQRTNRETGFSSGGSAETWVTVNLITVTPPEGSGTVAISAFGSGGMAYNSAAHSLAALRSRIVIAGNAGGVSRIDEFAAAGTQLAVFQAQHSRTFNTSSPFNVALQVQVADPASYPADSDNYATLSVIASFTG